MLNVTKRNYGEYSSSNYGANSICLDVGRLSLWFSYDTVVAFHNGDGLKVSENVWGSTTGKHLNWINPDKKSRLARKQFETELQAALKAHKLTI